MNLDRRLILGLDDIVDLREYERQREEFRSRIVALKKLRRVSVGPVITLVFENRDTIRFQIQEMARAERMASDAAIQGELDTYNPLIPGPGQLSATLFVELTDKEQMEMWLPRLVGVERSVEIVLGDGDGETVSCVVDEDHAARLTRQTVTASVHYIRFELSTAQVECFSSGTVAVAVNHPNYHEITQLRPATRDSLMEDLRGS